jgi:sugar lactone lactonase YvrE
MTNIETSMTSEKTEKTAPVVDAEIVMEHRIAGVDRIHGVTFDGEAVYVVDGNRERLLRVDPDSGQVTGAVPGAADAGTAFDGQHLWVAVRDRLHAIDPTTGEIVRTLPSPAGESTSGLAWAEGVLYVGDFPGRLIHKVDPQTGKLLKTIASDRMVTGISWFRGELWHGTVASREPGAPRDSEIRRIDPESGRVLLRVRMPASASVSGLEADTRGDLWAGDSDGGRLRKVRRPGGAKA